MKPKSGAVLSLGSVAGGAARCSAALLGGTEGCYFAGHSVGGREPKVGKSLLVANLALSVAAGAESIRFPIPAPRRIPPPSLKHSERARHVEVFSVHVDSSRWEPLQPNAPSAPGRLRGWVHRTVTATGRRSTRFHKS